MDYLTQPISNAYNTCMTKSDEYKKKLNLLEDWDSYLLHESGLPGPRGNLELAQVVANMGTQELFERYLTYDADQAPTNSPYEFLAFCGVVGMGRLLAEGKVDALETLRSFANDRRWRTREAVAMALQRLGDADMDFLIRAMQEWGKGTFLEQRTAAAALCEPKLLGHSEHAKAVLQILDEITTAMQLADNRESENYRVLRKGMGYCWSVAVAALPGEWKKAMEKWLTNLDKDVRWVMKENLKKERLARMDVEWVEEWQARI